LKINRVGHYSVQLLSYGKELHDDSSEMILLCSTGRRRRRRRRRRKQLFKY